MIPSQSIRTLNRRAVIIGVALACLGHTWSVSLAASKSESPQFNRDIRPILSDNCFSCHGPDGNQRKADLRLDQRESALTKKAIVPRNPEKSGLISRINNPDPDEIMPPPDTHKRLTATQKDLLQQWILNGAQYQRHWAFIAPTRPELPPVSNTRWPVNPIDRFVLARLEQQGITPSPEANRSTLVRRLTLDLTGLPPTPRQTQAFLNDDSPHAYEKLVDRLINTRAYAERRAQDWLDLARFADTRGFADDRTRTTWPYRDWVIDALDRNQPFDEFTLEQLAGDMLPEATVAQRIASGFHRNAPQAKGATYPVEEYRLKGVVDRVNVTGTVWLGLTVSCAECHDHKFDPVSQIDYYRLFALFNNIAHSGSGFKQGGPHMEYLAPAQQMEQDLLRSKIAAACRELPPPRSIAVWQKALEKLSKQTLNIPVMKELSQPRDTFVHVRGNFLTHGQKVTPGVPALFGVTETDQPRNRLEFARWLIREDHPLVARVVVNRFWQDHFAHGLVRTPDDFGLQGNWPTHPELLDWLACEFVENGWDMKAIHRLIVCSATYRQSARLSSELADLNPSNQLLARMPRPRLAAEQMRDQALAVAQLLSTRDHGPSVFPPQPDGYWETRALPGKWKTSTGADQYRRSIYTYWRRMALHPTMEILDAPARTGCTVRRNTANLPTQALVTLNDPIFVKAAKAFGRRLLHERTSDAARLELAFQLCLSRSPDDDEQDRFLDFLNAQTERYSRDLKATDIWSDSNNPQLAAWCAIASIMLNLDETLNRP